MNYVPFPLHLLPPPLSTYVEQASTSLGCDPAYVGVPLIPTIASAIGNTRRIRLKGDWTEPPVVWAGSVGDSGTVKSPAFELATKPAWKRQRKILRDYSKAVTEFQDEKREWKATPRDERGDEPEPPTACEHPLCSDITVEALVDRLLSTPRGVLVALDEWSAWFNSFNQYKSGGSDVGHWLAMHGARSVKVDRKTGDRKTIYVPNAAVCVTGTIQPRTLQRVLLPEFFDNGLVARLLVAMPPVKAKRWVEHEIPQSLAAEVDALFDKLYALRPAPGIDGEDEPVMVDLEDGARGDWVCFVDRWNEELQALEGNVRAAAAKLEAYAARFALIFHCIRQASGEKLCDYIDSQDIRAGIELAEWFSNETQRVYRAMSETDEDRQRRDLLDLIHRLGGVVTPRDLQRHCRRFKSAEEAELALRELSDDALGIWEVRTGGGGRPATMFILADSPDFPASHRVDVDTSPNSNGKTAFPSTSTPANGRFE